MKKQILTAALLSLLTTGLTAAELTVAATPVPHGDILRLVAPDLKAQGYDLKVVEFSDFVSPNIALDAKEVTANYYQHKPFLDCRQSQASALYRSGSRTGTAHARRC